MNASATKHFKSFLEYMAAFAKDAETFSKSGLLRPPKGTMNRTATQEWRRVAPRLYAMDRLWPHEIIALHAYCTAYSHWLVLNRKAQALSPDPAAHERYTALKPYAEQAQAHLKQVARSFGFFLDDSGRINLDQPLPLQPKSRNSKPTRLK